MSKVKFFESEDYAISFQATTSIIEGVEQNKELVIYLTSHYTKQKDLVMIFDQVTALEILNEMLSVVHEMRSIKIVR